MREEEGKRVQRISGRCVLTGLKFARVCMSTGISLYGFKRVVFLEGEGNSVAM